ncbi:MAG: hypothetical protein ACPHRO_09570 [Nannocystaceae bacterium]
MSDNTKIPNNRLHQYAASRAMDDELGGCALAGLRVPASTYSRVASWMLCFGFLTFISPSMASLLEAPPRSTSATESPDDDDGGVWREQANGVREVRYDDGESVDGDRLRPSGDRVVGGVSLQHHNLISPRAHFVDRLVLMAHDL